MRSQTRAHVDHSTDLRRCTSGILSQIGFRGLIAVLLKETSDTPTRNEGILIKSLGVVLALSNDCSGNRKLATAAPNHP